MNKPLLDAMFCAIQVLRETGGGFSPNEKKLAADELEAEMMRQIKESENEET